MTLETLYNRIYTDETTQDSASFLTVYEPHKELVDQAIVDHPETHQKVLRLTADYAHSLTIKENYKKALPVIDKAIGLFKTSSKLNDAELFKSEFYEVLVFDRAVANYCLKKFKAAEKDLATLNHYFPDNDKYKNWLASAAVYAINNVIKVCWYLFVAAIATTTFVDPKDIGIVAYKIILYTGLAALTLAVAAEIIKALRKRKIRR